MKFHIKALSLTAICCIAFGCAGMPTYLNKGYFVSKNDPPKHETPPVKLAVVPVITEYQHVVDSMCRKAFVDRHFGFEVIPPDSVRSILKNNDSLAWILDTLINYQFSKDELKANPNLFAVVNDQAIGVIRSSFGNAELLYLPTKFGVGSALLGTHAVGGYEVRLFDLRTGQLVFQRSCNMNLAVRGDTGREIMAAFIALALSSDFRECYEDRIMMEGRPKEEH